jgi:hypothetical protein
LVTAHEPMKVIRDRNVARDESKEKAARGKL